MSVVYSDFLFSAGIGIVVFIVIIKFGVGGGKVPKVKVDEVNDDVLPLQDEQKQPVAMIDEKEFMAKNKKLQKMFNLTDDQFKEAIETTNKDMSAASRVDDEVNWFTIIDKIIFLALVIFLLVAGNILSHGELGRILLGFFPDEFASLKLTEYLEKFHLIHNLNR